MKHSLNSNIDYEKVTLCPGSTLSCSGCNEWPEDRPSSANEEWRRLLDRDGRVIDGNIGNEWKVAYHSGRSMVECEKRLNKFIVAK